MIQTHPIDCPRADLPSTQPCGCIREPAPGDVYAFERPVSATGVQFEPGAPLVIVEHTLATPHDMISARGYNWVCEASNGRTVWHSIEQLLHQRALVLVGIGYKRARGTARDSAG